MKILSRTEVAKLRDDLRALDLVVAELDQDLRYVWIDNPHPDFLASAVVGKRDDDLASPDEVHALMDIKREAFAHQRPLRRTIGFHRWDGWRAYSISVYPVQEESGAINTLFTVGFESGNGIYGIIPICASCHAIRDESGQWNSLERYFEERMQSRFSHGICPSCAAKLYPDYLLKG